MTQLQKQKSKPKYSCWPLKLKEHVDRIARKGKNPSHVNRLKSMLEDFAATLDEAQNGTHTRLLTKYPSIPVKYFAAALGLPYPVGLKRYKKWFARQEIKPPLTGRTSIAMRAEWTAVVIEELGLI